jgi:membrane protease YdiL (CAAX protease family)
MTHAIRTERKQDVATGQYSLWQMVGIWLAAGISMWALGWLAYPAMSRGLPPAEAGLLRIRLLTIGLIWQFVLSMIILYREEGNIRWATIRRRFWLNNPVSPTTGETNKRLWWWLIPLVALAALLEIAVAPLINDLWTAALPALAEPPGYDATALFETPEMQAQWVGAWGLLLQFLLLAVFNTFLGEEFVHRGVLLPKMASVFGRWDWVANGVAFGLYHLHQPWGIPGAALTGLVFAFAGKRFRSNWLPIILHSGQNVFFLFLILGVVLGLA